MRRGPDLHVEDQGIKMLGTPFGHPEFVTAHLERITEEQSVVGTNPRYTICMVDLVTLCRSAGEQSVGGGATSIGAPVCRES